MLEKGRLMLEEGKGKVDDVGRGKRLMLEKGRLMMEEGRG